MSEYSYLGAGGIINSRYVEPDVTCDLTFQGITNDPYFGCLDRFGRTIQIPWIKSAIPIAGAAYEYDRSSNRTQMQPLGYTATDALQRYSYDGADRLARLIRGATNDMQGQEQWSLDATGNWRQYDVLDVDDASKNLAQSREANRANEITDLSRQYGANWPTPSYDRAGNTVTFPQPLTPTEGFAATYDAWNRLITLTKDGEESPTAIYAYDGLTRRITTTDASADVRRCYYTASWQAIEESLNSETTPDRQFTWGLRYLDDEICRDVSGTRLYGLQDANWNTVAVTSSSGTIQQRYRYSAYGQPTRLNPDGTVAADPDSIRWEHLYCGYRYEHTVGIYCVRYRWLLPPIGEWLIRDPLGYLVSMNLLHYARSCPTIYVDALGLMEVLSQMLSQMTGQEGPSISQSTQSPLRNTTGPAFPPGLPDRPIDYLKPIERYNCSGLAFRTYDYPDLGPTKSKLASKCSKQACDKKCKCQMLKCWFWEYTLVWSSSITGVPFAENLDFHIVCGLVPGPDPMAYGDDPSNICSKNGPRPIESRLGDGESFTPTPWSDDPLITKSPTNIMKSCYCCPQGVGK